MCLSDKMRRFGGENKYENYHRIYVFRIYTCNKFNINEIEIEIEIVKKKRRKKTRNKTEKDKRQKQIENDKEIEKGK